MQIISQLFCICEKNSLKLTKSDKLAISENIATKKLVQESIYDHVSTTVHKNSRIHIAKIPTSYSVPGSLVVRIPRSHRGDRGSIPVLGVNFC